MVRLALAARFGLLRQQGAACRAERGRMALSCAKRQTVQSNLKRVLSLDKPPSYKKWETEMILVISSNGNQGQARVPKLSAAGMKVRALRNRSCRFVSRQSALATKAREDA